MICFRCSRHLSHFSKKTPLSQSYILQQKTVSWRTYASDSAATPPAAPEKLADTPSTTTAQKLPKLNSSAPVGTPLKGINYLKSKTDPIALPDTEYPAWLWTCLTSNKPSLTTEAIASGADAQDLYSKSKAKRKAAARRLKALGIDVDADGGGAGGVNVPLDHQTVDLPSDDPEKASEARLQAKKVSRARRRASIKERNFLGGLR